MEHLKVGLYIQGDGIIMAPLDRPLRRAQDPSREHRRASCFTLSCDVEDNPACGEPIERQSHLPPSPGRSWYAAWRD